MIPPSIKVKNGALPDEPGVYFYYDAAGELLYVGKATSLRRRVGSYFAKEQDPRIGDMVARIARIDYRETPTVIEALVLEANQIKALKPKYNILQRDDKTYLYLVITRDAYPRPMLMRGLDLERLGVNPFAKKLEGEAKKRFLAVFGPYTSGPALRKALDIVRRAVPWSVCRPPEETGRVKPCFDVGLKKCPGVCIGAVSKKEYRHVIRQLMWFFEGKKKRLLTDLKKEMNDAAAALDFERAARLRNGVEALEHVRDVALITREDPLPFFTPPKGAAEGFVDLNGRVEAYDIAHLSGTSAVASMVVFEYGRPAKQAYRRFRIKTAQGGDDFASMEEVLRRRLKRAQTHPHAWPLPQVMVIDGGEGQVAVAEKVMAEFRGSPGAPEAVPKIIGIAKGFDRKQDRLVYDRSDPELARIASAGKELFQRARDEAHRFAGAYHRLLRSKRSLGTGKGR